MQPQHFRTNFTTMDTHGEKTLRDVSRTARRLMRDADVQVITWRESVRGLWDVWRRGDDEEAGSEENLRWEGEGREGTVVLGARARWCSSVLKQALLGHPSERGERRLASGVLQLQQVAHFADSPQRLAEEQGRTMLRWMQKLIFLL